jgi:hypothetical protein
MVPRRLLLRKTHECSGCIEFSSVLKMPDSSFPRCCPTSTKDMLPFNKSKIFTLSLKNVRYLSYMPFLAWEDYHNFYLAFWALFALGEACFHKIKGRKYSEISHNDLNTANVNTGLNAPWHQLSYITHMWELKFWFLKFLLIFKNLFLTTLSQNWVY